MKKNSTQTLLEKRIEKELALIEQRQMSDGSFESLASDSPDMKMPTGFSRTTFMTSLILSCLPKKSPSSEKIISKDLRFLLSQKSADWSWNYWVRGENVAEATHVLPDDIDDTFAALTALQIHCPELIDDTAFASITKTLTRTEEIPGGPYHTWIINRQKYPAWKDIDSTVNANVAYFLSLHEIYMPGIDTLLQKGMEENSHSSDYYFSPTAMTYFVSRPFSLGLYMKNTDQKTVEKTRKFIVKEIARQNNALETALAISALINYGASANEVEPYVKNLLNIPWSAAGIYKETVLKLAALYAGCDSLTAAFCIEAITKYRNLKTETNKN